MENTNEITIKLKFIDTWHSLLINLSFSKIIFTVLLDEGGGWGGGGGEGRNDLAFI